MKKNKAKFWLCGFWALFLVMLVGLVLLLPPARELSTAKTVVAEAQGAFEQIEPPDMEDPDVVVVHGTLGQLIELDEEGVALLRWAYSDTWLNQLYIRTNLYVPDETVMIELFDRDGMGIASAERNLLFMPEFGTYFIRLTGMPFSFVDLSFINGIGEETTYFNSWNNQVQFIAPASGYYEIICDKTMNPDFNDFVPGDIFESYEYSIQEDSIIVGMEEGGILILRIFNRYGPSMENTITCARKPMNGEQIELQPGVPFYFLPERTAYMHMQGEYDYAYYIDCQMDLQFGFNVDTKYIDFIPYDNSEFAIGSGITFICGLLSDVPQTVTIYYGLFLPQMREQPEKVYSFEAAEPWILLPQFWPYICVGGGDPINNVKYFVYEDDTDTDTTGKYYPDAYERAVLQPHADLVYEMYFNRHPIIAFEKTVFWQVSFWNDFAVTAYSSFESGEAQKIALRREIDPASYLIKADEPNAVITVRYLNYTSLEETEICGTGQLLLNDFDYGMCFITSDRSTKLRMDTLFDPDKTIEYCDSYDVYRVVYLDFGEHRFIAGSIGSVWSIRQISLWEYDNSNIVSGMQWNLVNSTVSPVASITKSGYYRLQINFDEMPYMATLKLNVVSNYYMFNTSIRTRTISLEAGNMYPFAFVPFTASGSYEISVSGYAELRLYDSIDKIGTNDYLVRTVGTKLTTGSIPRGQYYFT